MRRLRALAGGIGGAALGAIMASTIMAQTITGLTPSPLVNIKSYGAVMDGGSHPLSNYFSSQAQAEAFAPSLALIDAPAATTITTNGTTTVSAIGSFHGAVPGAVLTAADLPSNDTVKSVNIGPAGTTITLATAATGSNVGETASFTFAWQNAQMDWAAFDHAARLIAAHPDATSGLFNQTLYVPAGTMDIGGLPLNLTCINDADVAGDGCGGSNQNAGTFKIVFDGTVTCATGGLACLDGMGSRFIELIDYRPYGTSASEPGFALAHGRTVSTIGADHWMILRAHSEGYFAVTPDYNLASEENYEEKSLWHNFDNNGNAWAGILDGGNHFNYVDPYVNETITQDTAQSFQDFRCVSCDFKPLSGNSAGLWIYGGYGQQIDAYLTPQAASAPGITLYSDGTAGGTPTKLSLNVHTESGGAITHNISLVSKTAASTFYLPGLRYEENYDKVQASGSVFALGSNTTAAVLADATVLISGNTNTGVTLFDTPASYEVTDPAGLHLEGTGLTGGHAITGLGVTVGGNYCTQLGTSPTCGAISGSTLLHGEIYLHTGTGSPGSVGAVDIAPGFEVGSNYVCTALLAAGAAAWGDGATVKIGSISQTDMRFNWTNYNAGALTALTASTNGYDIIYNCGAMQ